MLREFWFPIFLTLAGTVLGVAGTISEGTPRKVWLTIAGAVWFAAYLSYIWGDPVRGPFYGLTHPIIKERFNLHAGITVGFPIHELSTGIDFSRAITLGDSSPINLKVTRTWWSGWKYQISLRIDSQHAVDLTQSAINGLPSDWDYNNDDNAVEIVLPDGQPVFQLIQSSDYDIYLNMVLSSGADRYTILNGSTLLLNVDENRYRKNKLTPIFKYPRYLHHGVRA